MSVTAGTVPLKTSTPQRYRTATAAELTALLNTFTASLPGTVPAPTTANGYFLKDNGTWAAAGSTSASDLTSGTLDDARLSANVTLQGNTFNSGNNLVQLSGGLLPAVDASNLINIPAVQVAGSGALNDSVLSANVTLLGNTTNAADSLLLLNSNGILPSGTYGTQANPLGPIWSNDSLRASDGVAVFGSFAQMFTRYTDNTLTDQRWAIGGTVNDRVVFYDSAGGSGAAKLVADGSLLTNLDAGQLTGTLPALDGGALTNINGASLQAGSVPDAALSANVTLQGNTFNGVSQLVQLDAGGLLPALDGSALFNLSASGLTGQFASGLDTSNLKITKLYNDTTQTHAMIQSNGADGGRFANTSTNATLLIWKDDVGFYVTPSGGTTSTGPFLYTGKCNGTPTGVPAGSFTGAPLYYDTTNRNLMVYNSGWKSVADNASLITTGTLAVANGGTGAATLTANQALIGNGTGAVTATPVFSSGVPLTNAKCVNVTIQNTAGTGNTDLIDAATGSTYTVPAGKIAIIGRVAFYNGNASTSAVYLALKVSGTYYRISNTSNPTTATGSVFSPAIYVLAAGDSLALNSTQNAQNCWAPIIEADNTAALKGYRILSLSNGDNTLYTCPASKSAVVCNAIITHNANAGGFINVVNNSGSSRNYSCNLVTSGGAVATTNRQQPATAIGDVTLQTLQLVGGLATGDFININTNSGTATQSAFITVIEY